MDKSLIVKRAQERMPAGATLLLLGEYGSSAHGVSLDNSDFDYMGVALEPKSVIYGLDAYEQTMLKPEGHIEGERTVEGELGGTLYAFKKYAKLASAGNTSIMSALYLPHYEFLSPLGEKLIQNRDIFFSKQVLKRFAGHLSREQRRMNGELAEKVLRPELVEKHGYDTKAAYQALKLAYHGLRFAHEGRIVIPFPKNEREYILSVRRGEVPAEIIREFLLESITKLDSIAETSTDIPELVDYSKLNLLMEELYDEAYS